MSNVTGHNNELKRQSYLEHIKKLNPTIVVTVDSRVGPNTERLIKNNTLDYNFFFRVSPLRQEVYQPTSIKNLH